MTVTPELRAAAKRINRRKAGEALDSIYYSLDNDWRTAEDRYEADAETLADAVLAGNDESPVTCPKCQSADTSPYDTGGHVCFNCQQDFGIPLPPPKGDHE